MVKVIDLLYILYILGIIGKFKGVVRDNGGYVVVFNYSMKLVYDVNLGDVYWVVLDVGWVVGYSYIVYGFLFVGCMIILYEGKLVKIFDVGVFWWVI